MCGVPSFILKNEEQSRTRLGQLMNFENEHSNQNLNEEAGEIIPVNVIAENENQQPEKDEKPAHEKSEDAYLEKLQRLQAEFTNYKKRVERERSQFRAQGKRELLGLLLPVFDDMDHFIMNHAVEKNEVVNGIELIYIKLFNKLTTEGLTRFGQVGEEFDPTLHEAILTEPCDEELDGKIISVWQAGYMFQDQLLRAAKVKVGKAERRTGDE